MTENKLRDYIGPDALTALLRLAGRWRRRGGKAGGACCEQEEANRRADEARKLCAADLELWVAESRDELEVGSADH